MLSLDQVKLLESRVVKAVERIQSLDAENARLRSQLSTLMARVAELEGVVNGFKDDQGRIEEGILSALDRLSAFEDSIFSTDSPATAQPQPDKSQSAENLSSQALEDPPKAVEDLADSILADDLAIEAEWQPKDDAPAGDGQMDIF
jgi:chromosome segregation ATPase